MNTCKHCKFFLLSVYCSNKDIFASVPSLPAGWIIGQGGFARNPVVYDDFSCKKFKNRKRTKDEKVTMVLTISTGITVLGFLACILYALATL